VTVRAAGWAWLLAGVAYIGCETVAAQRYPAYSYVRDHISALGIPGESPSATLMNAGAFVLHGILFAVAGVLIARALPPSRRRIALVALTVLNGVGNVLVGVFPSGSSSLHAVGAVLAIIGGNAAMVVGGGLLADLGAPRWFGDVCRVAGGVGIASFLTFAAIAGGDSGVEGAVERGSVYTIIAGDIAVGLVLLATGGSLTRYEADPSMHSSRRRRRAVRR
jgi:hypothetical membrane protein